MTLRQTMTDQIKNYYWLDYKFNQRCKAKAKTKPVTSDEVIQYVEDFESWLNSLNDEDFLSYYNSTREAMQGLDE